MAALLSSSPVLNKSLTLVEMEAMQKMKSLSKYISSLESSSVTSSNNILSTSTTSLLAPQQESTLQQKSNTSTPSSSPVLSQSHTQSKPQISQTVDTEDSISDDLPSESNETNIVWCDADIEQVKKAHHILQCNQHLLRLSASYYSKISSKLNIIASIFDGIGTTSILTSMVIKYFPISQYIIYSILIACVLISKALERINLKMSNDKHAIHLSTLSKICKTYIRETELELSQKLHKIDANSYIRWIYTFLNHLSATSGEIPESVLHHLQSKFA